MIPHSDIFEALFKKPVTDPGNRQMLQQVTEEHPYFTAAQFFLFSQADKQSADYKEQAARTALLFNNPLWLQWQLTYGDHPVPQLSRTVMAPAEVPAVEEETTAMPEAPVMAEPVAEIQEEAPAPAEERSIPEETEEQAIAEARDKQGSEEEPLFEPMHLVDYFASQGIKLNEEALQSDKLGKQLRSFTDWLKTMKKVHAGKLPATTEQAEKMVQHLAEKSNINREVLTEAMAEVFVKQGRNDKALELYEKLSLLNPSKNAYFAAKIAGLGG